MIHSLSITHAKTLSLSPTNASEPSETCPQFSTKDRKYYTLCNVSCRLLRTLVRSFHVRNDFLILCIYFLANANSGLIFLPWVKKKKKKGGGGVRLGRGEKRGGGGTIKVGSYMLITCRPKRSSKNPPPSSRPPPPIPSPTPIPQHSLDLCMEKWCLTFTETIRLIRDGENRGKGVWRW